MPMPDRNKPCPKCREVGHDKKGDHLWLMSDETTWACFKPYHKPYLERDDEQVHRSDVSFTTQDIKQLPIIGNPDRLITQETAAHYKVRVEFSETTGLPERIYYPETYAGKFGSYKCRKLPKKFSVMFQDESFKGIVPDLFGQWCSPRSGKRLLICAGEEDTLAAYQMLQEKYPDWDHAVVGLPRGEEGHAPVAENMAFLNGFDEVIIATDMDAAGRSALAKLVPIVGEKARTLEISEKDISDMLVKGKKKEFLNAFFSAKEYRPSTIVLVSDILEDAVKPVKWGLDYPFPKLTKLTYGMKEGGEIIGIGAGPGSGKSTIFQQFQRHLMFHHKEPIAVFDIEEGATFGLKKLIGSEMNRPIHLPDCEYDQDVARTVGKRLAEYANFYGGDSENWCEVEDAIRYFASKGIRFFFIDPLSALVEHLSASDGNTELGKIMRSMRRFRKHQGLTFFHANHLNNPISGKDHGEGGAVRGSQFSGSRAQWKYSTLLMGLEGNQLAETEEEKHKRKLVVIKDRLGGKTGVVNLKYDPVTGVLSEDILEERL
jgi:twinkle protein